MSMRTFIFVLSAILLLPATGTLASDQHVIYDRKLGNWNVQCTREFCLVTLIVTHGAGNTTTVVKIDRATLKPDNFSIVISGNVDQEKGVTVQFVKTLVDAKNPECAGGPQAPKPVQCYRQELLAHKTFNGNLDCGYQKCFAKFPGQTIGTQGSPGRINLLNEYEDDDALLILWNDKNGNLKTVMLDIDGFKQAYDAALSVLRNT